MACIVDSFREIFFILLLARKKLDSYQYAYFSTAYSIKELCCGNTTPKELQEAKFPKEFRRAIEYQSTMFQWFSGHQLVH